MLDMRTRWLVVAAALVGCSSDISDTDDAIAEGEQRGDDFVAQIDDELAGEPDPGLVIAKSTMITMTLDDGEIMHADFVLDRSGDPVVLDFAQFMVDEHSAHQDVTISLLADYDLAPVQSNCAINLMADASSDLAFLQGSRDFDYEYMRLQVVMHNAAFAIVDALQDYAPDASFALFLADTRATIAAHRDEAEDTLRAME
jgi:predicted outer membrane protein